MDKKTIYSAKAYSASWDRPTFATGLIAHEMFAMTLEEQSVFKGLSQDVCTIEFRISL
jgi:hypothetical protein